jgi:ureidoglycolate lyase
MKLVRFGPVGRERPGIVDKSGEVRDCTSIVPDWTGEHLSEHALSRLRGMDLTILPRAAPGERLGPCVGSISKVICVGLNYADHAAESNLPVPDFPILFFKAPTAACGPNDDVELPAAVVQGQEP